MARLKIVFASLARTTFDIHLAAEITKIARDGLVDAGFSVIEPEKLLTDINAVQQFADSLKKERFDLLLVFQATFSDSTMVLTLVEEIDAPIFLWAVPEEHTGGRLRLNSFCGINLAGHALTKAGYPYEFAFAAPDEASVIKEIITVAQAGHARNLLRNARLGRLGENPDGFETCDFDQNRLRKEFGMDVVQFNLEDDIFPQVRIEEPEVIHAIYKDLESKVEGLKDLDKGPTEKTLSVYSTLGRIAKQQKISGFAVRCWPEFFTELGCAACGAMSMLSDEMIPCSCEADVNGTITQMMLQFISGEPAFGTDVVSIDREQDTVIVWHCGLAPLSMADPEKPIGVTIHSNRKLPLLFNFPLKPGIITISRLSESTGNYRLVIGKAKVLRGPQTFSGTTGRILFDRPAAEVLDIMIREGLEHHISLTYGDHVPALSKLADLLGLPVLKLAGS